MSLKYLNGHVVFSTDEEGEIESAIRHITNTTEVGIDFKKNYYQKDHADWFYDKLVAAACQVSGGNFIGEHHLQHAMTLLIQAGEFRPKVAPEAAQLAEPEEDNTPRDKNGKPLTQAQIAWGEMTRFAETASMADISRRKASDPAFANFVRKSLQQEMVHEIDGAVTPIGQPTTKTRANQDLIEFAHKYNTEPIANLKPRGGFVLLGGEQIPYNQFIEMVNKATAARLL
jgi:hypothetical protein